MEERIKGIVIDHTHHMGVEEMLLDCNGRQIAIDVKGIDWLWLAERLVGCEIEVIRWNGKTAGIIQIRNGDGVYIATLCSRNKPH